MGATTGTDLSASCVLRFIWALCTWRATWREVSSEVSSDFLASYFFCLAAPPPCPVGHQRHTCTPNKHNNPPTPPTSTLDTPRRHHTRALHTTRVTQGEVHETNAAGGGGGGGVASAATDRAFCRRYPASERQVHSSTGISRGREGDLGQGTNKIKLMFYLPLASVSCMVMATTHLSCRKKQPQRQ